MIVSELEFMAEDVGLTFSNNKAPCLSGIKNGFPMEIYENKSHEFIIYCHADIPAHLNNTVRDYVKKWEKCLQKDTVRGKSISDGRNGYVRIVVNAVRFEAENVLILLEFLEKLPLYLNSKGISPSNVDVTKIESKEALPVESKKNLTRGEFFTQLFKGIGGGILGGILGSLIFLILINISGYISWFGGVAIGFLTVYFFRRFAKRMSIVNTIVCGIMVLVTVFYSCITGAAIEIFMSLNVEGAQTVPSVFDIFADMPAFLDADFTAKSNLFNNLLLGYVFAVFTAGGFFAYHFARNPKEMY